MPVSESGDDIVDLLIVGGGINGAGIARDAAGRGLKVLLVEQADLATLISGGDDFEILCTIPEARRDAFCDEAKRAGVALTEIGVIVAGQGRPRFRDERGQAVAIERLSFSHF